MALCRGDETTDSAQPCGTAREALAVHDETLPREQAAAWIVRRAAACERPLHVHVRGLPPGGPPTQRGCQPGSSCSVGAARHGSAGQQPSEVQDLLTVRPRCCTPGMTLLGCAAQQVVMKRAAAGSRTCLPRSPPALSTTSSNSASRTLHSRQVRSSWCARARGAGCAAVSSARTGAMRAHPRSIFEQAPSARPGQPPAAGLALLGRLASRALQRWLACTRGC